MAGDARSGLQGYLPDAFLHTCGIACAWGGQRGKARAEDFSVAGCIHAAELTYIHSERKWVSHYFKPLQGAHVMPFHMIAVMSTNRTARPLVRAGQGDKIGIVYQRNVVLMKTGQMKCERNVRTFSWRKSSGLFFVYCIFVNCRCVMVHD